MQEILRWCASVLTVVPGIVIAARVQPRWTGWAFVALRIGLSAGQGAYGSALILVSRNPFRRATAARRRGDKWLAGGISRLRWARLFSRKRRFHGCGEITTSRPVRPTMRRAEASAVS